jgi:hypothetical protein
MNDRPGASFEESEVVDLYPFRPPYPEAVFQKLRQVAPGTTRCWISVAVPAKYRARWR